MLRMMTCVKTDAGGRLQIGTVAGFKSESPAGLRRNSHMRAAQARGRHLGRPKTPQRVVSEIEAIATSTDLSIRAIQKKIGGRASRAIVGEITKRARANQSPPL